MPQAKTKAIATPGPWHHTPMLHGVQGIYGPDGYMVADAGRTRRSDAEQEANARLIAAAPELLEGARQVVEWRDLIRQNYPDMAGLIRGMDDLAAAIAKAEGE